MSFSSCSFLRGVHPVLRGAVVWGLFVGGLVGRLAVAQETILQYFNTSWKEIERRLPEVAEAGYTSLWLPPPCKGSSGGFSVGYDVLDRFDLGDKDQAGQVATKYGTKADLLRLMEMAHRFGLRVYFDNVMAHNGGPLDPVAPGTLFPGIPGFVPEDFHLVQKTGGGWRKASDSVDYNDEWQVLNRNPFAWDIAQESPNTSFNPTGTVENNDYPKWVGIRHPGRSEWYLDADLTVGTNAEGQAVHPFANKEPYQDSGYGAAATGAGNGRFDWNDVNANGDHDVGEAAEPFTDTGVDPTNPARQGAAWGYADGVYNLGDIIAEDVNAMILRSARWITDQTRCDGFRLDAVKHVPAYFFGQQSGATKDSNGSGFLGSTQEQFNVTRGFTDWANHRDTGFSSAPRNDALFFGEHLGAPPNPSDYLAAGMRMANDDFLNRVGGFSGIGGNLSGYDAAGAFTYGVDTGVMYCLSHDNNSMATSERPAAHAYMLTRAGLPIVYTDGFNQSGAPDYFPKPSLVPFLGQFGTNWVTGPLAARRDLARGDQIARWQSQNLAAWEFRDTSENAAAPASESTVLLVMHARNYTSGQVMPFGTAFPAGVRLRNVSPNNGAFYATVGNDGLLRGDDGAVVTVPSGVWFGFSYARPELPDVWTGVGGKPAIEILQNGVPASRMTYQRTDGKNGDPAYAYAADIPRITSGAALTFLARGDGSTENILLKLDAGVDLNSQHGLGPVAGTDRRDHKPGAARDTFQGYEQMQFVRRLTEKFAATDTVRNGIGSSGAESWLAQLQAAPGAPVGFTRTDGSNTITTNTSTATWVYHDPAGAVEGMAGVTQFDPPPSSNGVTNLRTVRVKIGYKSSGISNVWLYLTRDGSSPNGSNGVGKGTTQVIAMAKEFEGASDAGGVPEWFKGQFFGSPTVRYKIGVHRNDAASRFPDTADQVAKRGRMETVFQLGGLTDASKAINAAALTVWPHNDFGNQSTGLSEGFHVVRSRSFLNRSGGSPRPGASIFRTATQTFYYDAERPMGSIAYPGTEGQTIGGSTYGIIIRTDASVTGVQCNLLDSNSANDLAANGNGADLWAAATEVTGANLAGKEWRFEYKGIPSSGLAQIRVRLRELSSSATNPPLSAEGVNTDAQGWFTTLVRSVNTGYPVNYRIRYPETDGTVVSDTYQAKIYFDKSLGYAAGVPLSSAQILSEMRITIDGVLAPPAGYGFLRDETGSESAVTFTFPNLYTGSPDDLHEVRATWTRGDISLTDIRQVKAFPGPIADADGDGLPNYWEIQNRLEWQNPDGTHGGAGDYDGDGLTNLQEYLADLNPADPSDGQFFPQARMELMGGGYRFTFPARPGRTYRLQSSTSLQATGVGSWSTLGAPLTTAISTEALQATDPSPSQQRKYYRVMISVP
jgi:glycosidase